LSKQQEETIPLKHVRKDGKERSFKGTVVKDTPDYKLIKPDRVLFVQLVKFAPGKGPNDYVQAYKDLDRELMSKYNQTRCQMDCHEIVTFLTLGRYDMVVLWDAPDLETYQKVVAASVNPGTGYGSSETHTTLTAMMHTG
jgi:uncharacterized protein with GYD domain